jgi:phosphatidylglycerophosphate synthase
MIIRIGRKLSTTHDKLRLEKDKRFIPLIKILPKWLTPNHVTIFRTIILVVWFPFAVFKPSLIQEVIYFVIYFFDLLDGAMARLQNRVTFFGGYLDHISDKFSNITALIVIYGITGYQFKFIMFFIYWDVLMSLALALECYFRKDLRSKKISYLKGPFEFVVKTILFILLIVKVLPALI